MALAIWLAARSTRISFYVEIDTFFWITLGLFVGAFLAMFFRWRRRASLADIAGTPILDAFLLVRFVLAPAGFLLLIFSLLASMIGLDFSATLWIATIYIFTYGLQALLLTSLIAELAAAVKGPRRDSPAGS